MPVDVTTAPVTAWRRAAVLVLLYERENELYFPLTQRPETISRHPGQISLPGGMFELEDAGLWETALRETYEELGIPVEGIVPVGRLDDVTVRVGDSVITPFVGWHPAVPALRPDPSEVAEVLEVPLESLLHPESIEEELWELRGQHWRVAFYRLENRVVWGITGAILSDLHDRLEAGERAVRPGTVRPLA